MTSEYRERLEAESLAGMLTVSSTLTPCRES